MVSDIRKICRESEKLSIKNDIKMVHVHYENGFQTLSK